MDLFRTSVSRLGNEFRPVLDEKISIQAYARIDLSAGNPHLTGLDLSDPMICEEYIKNVREENRALVAYGGYLEKRSLYSDYTGFSGQGDATRNVHLGMDFWAEAGTQVITPLDGRVHSFRNNARRGDYGPTIILEHNAFDLTFYTLYGHLSVASLEYLYPGKNFLRGEPLAKLGTSAINVNYAPHLHFQIILDIGNYLGDYPGVSAAKDLEYYKNNCPDPDLLLKIGTVSR